MDATDTQRSTFDDLVVAHFTRVPTSAGIRAVERIAGTPGVSAALLAELTADRSDGDPEELEDLRFIAAGNPGLDPETLRAWLDGSAGGRVADGAARNPALGPEIEQLYTRVPRRVAISMIANPACPSRLLVAAWERNIHDAAANPALPERIVEHIAINETVTNVYRHPAIGAGRLHTALTSDDAPSSLLLHALANPALDDSELDAFLERARHHSPAPHPLAVHVAAVESARRTAECDPAATPVAALRYLPFIEGLAVLLDDADTTTGGAISTLLAAGFAGTVGELLAVAGGVTAVADVPGRGAS